MRFLRGNQIESNELLVWENESNHVRSAKLTAISFSLRQNAAWIDEYNWNETTNKIGDFSVRSFSVFYFPLLFFFLCANSFRTTFEFGKSYHLHCCLCPFSYFSLLYLLLLWWYRPVSATHFFKMTFFLNMHAAGSRLIYCFE